MDKYQTTLRDRFVGWACNMLISKIASKEYRAFLSVILNKGREELDRELGIK